MFMRRIKKCKLEMSSRVCVHMGCMHEGCGFNPNSRDNYINIFKSLGVEFHYSKYKVKDYTKNLLYNLQQQIQMETIINLYIVLLETN